MWRELGSEMDAARADDVVARHSAMAKAAVRDLVRVRARVSSAQP